MKLEHFADHFRIDKLNKFRLADYDPADCCGLTLDKAEAKAMLTEGIERLSDLQQRLYASDRWSVLIVLQGMDASGKDSLIKHVMSGLNPQGVQVTSFKQPSVEELDHDFLWRIVKHLPERGRIGIFNRSHYEEVLVARVHPKVLDSQMLPREIDRKTIWQDRFDDIRAFERHLARNGTVVLKFFLHMSRAEQRKQFLERIEDPAKRWKFSMSDVTERELWPKYMDAYEEAIRETSTAEAPWFVVPANNKWFTRLTVAAAIADALDRLKLEYPKVEGEALKELQTVRKTLVSERDQ